jgi:hypothetical protein
LTAVHLIRTYALPLYLVGVIRESPLHLGLDKAICVSPINIFSNNLSTVMLRPYRYLWFIRRENCCRATTATELPLLSAANPLSHPLSHPLPIPYPIPYPIRCQSVIPSAANPLSHPLPIRHPIRCQSPIPSAIPSAANPSSHPLPIRHPIRCQSVIPSAIPSAANPLSHPLPN